MGLEAGEPDPSNVFSFPRMKRIIPGQQQARCPVSHTTTILVAGIAALIGGIVGGATTSWMRSDAPKPAASVRHELPDYDDLSMRIEALESQVGRLAQQRWAPAALPTPAQAAPADSTARPANPIDTPVFEAAVRDVIERMEHDRAEDRAARRTERQTQQAQRWVDRLAGQASLTEEQKAKLVAIAREFQDRLRQGMESDGGPISREEFVERRNAARAESEKKLGEVLSPQQMQTYKESDNLRIDRMARGGGRGGQ